MEFLISLGGFYDKDFVLIRDDIEILGSPERSEKRFVIEDSMGKLYVAEKVFKHLIPRKIRISETLEYLNLKGLLRITTYLRNRNKGYITDMDGSSWQVIPFVKGVELKRPFYVFDRWRGKALADFLISLRRRSDNIPFFIGEKNFSTREYILSLLKSIEINNFSIYKKLIPVVKFLEKDFFNIHDNLPVSFCHGDFHPVNIIWGENEINSVIDWEFCGIKHEIYDLANLIGCLGVENPDSLAGDLMEELFKKIIAAGIYKNKSMESLLDYVIAIRFAWMSEWLRKNDKEMISLELTYMNLLIDNYEFISRIWNLSSFRS